MPGAAGPVSMMLMEHQFGRWHVSRMAEAAKSYADGKREAGAEWADAALDRATLPREHIAKENSVLVRYVASRLTCIKSALKAVCLACMMRKVFWRWRTNGRVYETEEYPWLTEECARICERLVFFYFPRICNHCLNR